MQYMIPRGAPVEIGLGGADLCPHVTKRDLTFSTALASAEDELTFHDGYWRIVVAKALVLQLRGGQLASGVQADTTEQVLDAPVRSTA